MKIVATNPVQLLIPESEEGKARACYVGLLGSIETPT
jgi:hypothetical protein